MARWLRTTYKKVPECLEDIATQVEKLRQLYHRSSTIPPPKPSEQFPPRCLLAVSTFPRRKERRTRCVLDAQLRNEVEAASGRLGNVRHRMRHSSGQLQWVGVAV